MQWRQATGLSAAPHNRDGLQAGLLMLVCADVIRPSLGWMVRKASNRIVPVMATCRDPQGYASLRDLIDADPDGITAGQARLALGRITMILACKGGLVRDITVGDYLDLLDAMRDTGTGGAGRLLAYRLLHGLGHLGPDAPVTGRAFLQAAGQRTVEELVDRYQVQCRPVRDLLVEYLRERQPAVDYVTLSNLAGDLVRLFWADLERHHPGIDSINLAAEIAAAWRHRVSYRPVTAVAPGGDPAQALVPRAGARSVMMTVRAFYLDIAQWALDEPHRWAQWAVPCPVRETDCNRAKHDKLVKSRMDQRTRERLPLLPALARAVSQHRLASAALLDDARQAPPGDIFTSGGQSLRRLPAPTAYTGSIWASPAEGGPRTDLTRQESEAFWAWAFVEVLRHTGIRFEELRELSHHSITQYRLPSTGELVPLLQIAPSKAGAERLLLVSPELADVLSAIIARIRASTGAIPLVPSYDIHEKTWNPPMPLLFQRAISGEHRPISDGSMREILQRALAGTGIRGHDGQPLIFTPHDFRRIFVTDAIMNGLPPHIAQVICGHRDINTTMGYKAIYPAEAIEAHRALHRPPPAGPSQRGIPDTDRGGMGRIPRPLRKTQAVHRHLRPRLRHALHPRARLHPLPDAAPRPQPSTPGSRRSATTCSPASPKPNAKDGTAKPKASRSASQESATNSPRSPPPLAPSASACPHSTTSRAGTANPAEHPAPRHPRGAQAPSSENLQDLAGQRRMGPRREHRRRPRRLDPPPRPR